MSEYVCRRVWDDGLGGDKGYNVVRAGVVVGSVWSEGRARWRASTGPFAVDGTQPVSGRDLHGGWNFASTRQEAVQDLIFHLVGQGRA